MSDTTYRILLELFHEDQESFQALSLDVRLAFHARLFAKP